MNPFHKLTALAAPLDRTNVDTDQIIPKQFLKRIERTGYGEFLFFDWRRPAAGAPAGGAPAPPGGAGAFWQEAPRRASAAASTPDANGFFKWYRMVIGY